MKILKLYKDMHEGEREGLSLPAEYTRCKLTRTLMKGQIISPLLVKSEDGEYALAYLLIEPVKKADVTKLLSEMDQITIDFKPENEKSLGRRSTQPRPSTPAA